MLSGRVGSFITSGWTPSVLLALLVSYLQLATGTSARDLLVFSLYAALGLIVPGTLLWRLVRPEHNRFWLEDVVFGAITAYAIEIAFYLPTRAVGLPQLVACWPLAVYLIALATRTGRRRALHAKCTVRAPASWSWSIAGVLAYLTLFITRASWWDNGLTPNSLRTISADGSFHLALTGELRHHVPPVIPWVVGEPLHYHWLTYVHTASATWLTGIEAIVVLRRLAPLVMIFLVVLATALLAARVANRAATGALAAILLVVVHSPAFASSGADLFQRKEFTSQVIFGSPTMTFGLLLFCGVLLLTFEVINGEISWSTWPLLGLLLAASSGAKATFSPMMLAGVLSVVAVSAANCTTLRRHCTLLAVSLGNWILFQFGFYSGETSGLRLTASGTIDFAAVSIGAESPPPWSFAWLAFLAVIALLWSVHMAGMLSLVGRRGWRHPIVAFIFGFTLSGLGASLLLDLGLFSQQWFLSSTHVAAAVGAAWGLGLLMPAGTMPRLLPIATWAALLAWTTMAAGWLLSSSRVPPLGAPLTRLLEYAAPFLLAVTGFAVLTLSFRRLAPHSAWRTNRLMFLCVGLTSLGLFRSTQLLLAMAEIPWGQPQLDTSEEFAIGRGGVHAARWLRANSAPRELLATNGHTLTPDSDLPLAFWLSGFSERRVLVESWGYTPHHARIMARTRLDFDQVPFWDPVMLNANDRAFETPTRARLDELHEDYGVTWLVLDRRFASDELALTEVTAPSYSRGDYVVYRIP